MFGGGGDQKQPEPRGNYADQGAATDRTAADGFSPRHVPGETAASRMLAPEHGFSGTNIRKEL